MGSEEQPGWYRVMDDLEFGLDIHELSEGQWQPYRQGLPCTPPNAPMFFPAHGRMRQRLSPPPCCTADLCMRLAACLWVTLTPRSA